MITDKEIAELQRKADEAKTATEFEKASNNLIRAVAQANKERLKNENL